MRPLATSPQAVFKTQGSAFVFAYFDSVFHMSRCSLMAAACFALFPFHATASPDSVVVFNEIHYNPAGASENGEWIELCNQMGIRVDISGWRFDGIGYTFPPNTIVQPGAFIVVAKTPGAGQFGPFSGSIANSGEQLRLINQSDRMMDEIEFGDNDPWPPAPDNSGVTLAKRLPYTSSGPSVQWTHSAQVGGTPGANNFPTGPDADGIRLNEISATNVAAGTFFLELINTSGSTLSYSGLVISRGTDVPAQFTLPSGSLAPGGLLLVTEGMLGFRPANDEKLFLFNGAKSAVLDSRQATNRLRGLSPAHGSEWMYPSAPTPGSANSFSISEAIVISEILYDPPSLPPAPAVPAVYQTQTLSSYNQIWRYNSSDANLPADWAMVAHPATGNWKSATGPIGVESSTLPVPLSTTATPFSASTVTHYFERDFSLSQAELDSADSLELTHQIDDGAVFYLNGVEIHRFNMPPGAVGPETTASTPVNNATLVSVTLPPTGLIAGSNRISVEVHQIHTTSSDMVFGLKLDLRRLISPATAALPMRDSDNQWVEIANRSNQTVDLTDWSLADGISFNFAPGTLLSPGEHASVVKSPTLFAAAHPSARILGTFTGSLSRSGENIELRDPSKNIADRVRYFEGGQWPEAADGGGSSLELRDLDADNSRGSAWAASDESRRTAWKTYTYDSTAAASKGADAQWSEFNLGMLSAGEIWLDDVSVIENPSGAATQKLSDPGFNNASVWRLRGNHRHTQIINEPGNPGNKILRIVASGPTEHMHNQIETTLASVVTNGLPYRISYRARWVSGMNQLHTRLYFNRAAKMTAIDRPANPGTPSAPNSRAAANIGPTYASLRHSPAVPAALQSTTVSVAASDPENVTSLSLLYSVNGGSFASVSMFRSSEIYQAVIPGQAAGAVVQFYILGTDGSGMQSFHPAGGSSSRALYKVADGTAATNGLHNFRIVTTNADRDFMHQLTEVMSNDRIECTIIDREGDIYYGAGVRLKSSQRGRDENGRVGYNIEFPPDGLFRGAHAGLAVDRSEGQTPGQRELLFDTFISNSGGSISRYNDLIKVLSPKSELTGTAILQMARYEDVFLDAQFEDGSNGTLYEYELVYYPTTANASGLKLPSPDNVVNVNRILDNGNSIEDYRWNFLNKINREAENFTPIMNYCKLFGLTGPAFETGVESCIDVDTWFRGMACAVLTGAGDNAAAGSFHNGIYYARPDGRIVFLPHDMDYAFDATRSIYANLECAALTANAARRRIYLGHLHDIISTTYNNSYMSSWASHFAALDPAQNWSAELSFINSRSSYVSTQINSQIPPVAFAITTPSPMTTGGLTATLAGTGWVNVRNIRVAGTTNPLAVTWTGTNTWQASIAATPGLNTVTLEALDFSGAVIGTASIAINATTLVEPASSSNLVISEIMYHPADPSPAEVNAGFVDPEAFEYLELTNIGTKPVNLTGVRFVGNLEYDFASEATLAPGARTLIARDRAAFSARYPSSVSLLAAGAFLNGTGLNNAGELIQLTAANGQFIRNFSYSDAFPWPMAADGTGYSLVLIAPSQNPDHGLPSNWRASIIPGGNPGASDSRSFAGNANLDVDHDGLTALMEHALGTSDNGRNTSGIMPTRAIDNHIIVSVTRSLAADDVLCVFESSTDLVTWVQGFDLVSETPTGDGTVDVVMRSVEPMSGNFYFRLKVSRR